MKGENTAVGTHSAANITETKISASPETITAEILQGVFASETDRDAFLQAITMHGFAFLRDADKPLSQSSTPKLTLSGPLTHADSHPATSIFAAGGRK